MSVCGLCVCEGRRDSRLTRENECDVGVAMTYGHFPDDLSGFVATERDIGATINSAPE